MQFEIMRAAVFLYMIRIVFISAILSVLVFSCDKNKQVECTSELITFTGVSGALPGSMLLNIDALTGEAIGAAGFEFRGTFLDGDHDLESLQKFK